MEFLRACGCEWSADGMEMVAAACSRHPEVLQYCLVWVRDRCWREAMIQAYMSGSVECM
jgi:hypothetical protein